MEVRAEHLHSRGALDGQPVPVCRAADRLPGQAGDGLGAPATDPLVSTSIPIISRSSRRADITHPPGRATPGSRYPRYGNLLPPNPGHKAAANCQESQKHRAPRMGKLPMAGVTSSGRASCACVVSLLWGSLILRARAYGRAAGRCPRDLASGTRVWPVCAAATASGARMVASTDVVFDVLLARRGVVM